VHVPYVHALAGSGLGSLFRLSRWKIFDALEVIFKPMSTTKSFGLSIVLVHWKIISYQWD
jgi:hypothetical protein